MAGNGKRIIGWGLAGVAGVAALTQSFGNHPPPRSDAQVQTLRSQGAPDGGAATVDNPFDGESSAAHAGVQEVTPVTHQADADAETAKEAAPEPPARVPSPLPDAAPSGFSCERRTCGQMSSCEEANYHLDVCGDSRLDRDHDGVPCESICG